jgi:putative aminopeptidase FrvX
VTDGEYLDFLTELSLLVRAPAVTGAENPFFRLLQRELERAGASVIRYEGLLVAKGRHPERGMLSAHVDRNGLWCTGPGEFKYAAFLAAHRGEKDGDSVSERTLHKIVKRFIGEAVQAYEPWGGGYLGQAVIEGADMSGDGQNVVFQVPGLNHLPPGIPLAYLDELERTNGGLTAQLDNILTVAMLVYLFRRGYAGTALFAAQEEAGRSWRFLESWFQREGRVLSDLVVLDTSPYPDPEAAARQDVVLRRKDAHGGFRLALVERLATACEEMQATYSFKDECVEAENVRLEAAGERLMSLGRTELGRLVQSTQGAVNGATLQVPTFGYHTSAESALDRSVRASLRVLTRLFLD